MRAKNYYANLHFSLALSKARAQRLFVRPLGEPTLKFAIYPRHIYIRSHGRWKLSRVFSHLYTRSIHVHDEHVISLLSNAPVVLCNLLCTRRRLVNSIGTAARFPRNQADIRRIYTCSVTAHVWVSAVAVSLSRNVELRARQKRKRSFFSGCFLICCFFFLLDEAKINFGRLFLSVHSCSYIIDVYVYGAIERANKKGIFHVYNGLWKI